MPPKQPTGKQKFNLYCDVTFKIILDLLLLYCFLVSIKLMSHSFKGFGSGFAETLIQTTSNPFIGLFVGIFTTSLVQSSSVTTSMVVAFVMSGTITIHNAVPIVMGANIGTTVTSVVVSMGHITRKEEFRRALSGATVHDFFNLITVIILLPLELKFGMLRKAASFMAGFFQNIGGVKITSPLKIIIKPAVAFIDNFVRSYLGVSDKLASGITLIIALVCLFVSLYYMVKIMKSLIVSSSDVVVDKLLGGNFLLAISFGAIFTAIIQSSSVTTSLLVPLVAAGIITVEVAFPVTLGANVGTTVTAILAALAGNVSGITIAFVHLLFNLCGILIIYPYKKIRTIPINLSKWLANQCAESKIYAFIFVLGIFYFIPGILILIYRLIN